MTRIRSDSQASIEEHREQLYSDYRATFGTPHGKRVLDDLKNSCYWKQSTFSRDPFATAFNEGMRNVLLKIWMHITDKPEPPQTMADEGDETL